MREKKCQHIISVLLCIFNFINLFDLFMFDILWELGGYLREIYLICLSSVVVVLWPLLLCIACDFSSCSCGDINSLSLMCELWIHKKIVRFSTRKNINELFDIYDKSWFKWLFSLCDFFFLFRRSDEWILKMFLHFFCFTSHRRTQRLYFLSGIAVCLPMRIICCFWFRRAFSPFLFRLICDCGFHL